ARLQSESPAVRPDPPKMDPGAVCLRCTPSPDNPGRCHTVGKYADGSAPRSCALPARSACCTDPAVSSLPRCDRDVCPALSRLRPCRPRQLAKPARRAQAECRSSRCSWCLDCIRNLESLEFLVSGPPVETEIRIESENSCFLVDFSTPDQAGIGQRDRPSAKSAV